MKLFFALFAASLLSTPSFAQQEPWKKDQVLPTAGLAAKIQSGKDIPLILNVGPMENIKTAVKVGATNTEDGIRKLESMVSAVDKSKEIVLYCGCCTYSNCPNIRPAFTALEKLGFKNVRVLYIPEGIKPDWSGKGFPME